jgi:phytoene dehydrogenase-like protein
MASMKYDAVVIGAGHNGLVAANYLAKAGMRVIVLERRNVPGGACVTEEVWPGFRISRLAYAYSLFNGDVVKELDLKRHGLEIVSPEIDVFVPFGDGTYLALCEDVEKTKKEIAKFSTHDVKGYEEYSAFWKEVGLLLSSIGTGPPPPLKDIAALLEEPESTDLMKKVIFYSVRDLLDEFFEDDHVKAAFMARGLIGTFASPSTPGTAYVLGHHVIGEAAGGQGVWGYPRGGMGGLSFALVSALKEAGGEMLLGASVSKIEIKDSAVVGVALSDGRTIETKVVLANSDPKQTMLKLVGEEHLDSGLAKRLRQLKDEGCVVKLNAALKGLPKYKDYPTHPGPHLEGITGIGPSPNYFEKAYFDALTGRFSEKPLLRVVYPTVTDPSLAPKGYHTMSVFAQYFPYNLRGRGWDESKELAADAIFNTLEEFAPGIRDLVYKYEVLTPLDMEREFSLPRGNIFHLEILPSQMLSFRPTPELSGYKTPIKGLYLCGSGSHPGGGVTGGPGFNAAKIALKDLGKLN